MNHCNSIDEQTSVTGSHQDKFIGARPGRDHGRRPVYRILPQNTARKWSGIRPIEIDRYVGFEQAFSLAVALPPVYRLPSMRTGSLIRYAEKFWIDAFKIAVLSRIFLKMID